MKKNIFNFTYCLCCFIFLGFIFLNNKEITTTIIDALNLFFTKVFPSLFPLFILNDFLISFNLPYYFYYLFNNLFKKLFKTSGLCAYVFIMCLISGTPSQAYILKTLLENNKITSDEANHYLTFTYFSNPLFLFTMLNLIFPSNITLKIILIHYFSNLIIAFLIRSNAPKVKEEKLELSNNKITLAHTLNKSISTLLMILGTITFYMLLNYIISNLFNLPNLIKIFLSGFLEITNGLNSLVNIQLNLKLKEIIATLIISFGGLSIHSQIKSLLEDTKIKYNYFLKGRIMQTIISFILILIF